MKFNRRDLLKWAAVALPASVVAPRIESVEAVTVRSGHPRLLFTSNDIPAIRAKLTEHYGSSSAYPDIKGSFQTAINECDQMFGTINDVTNARFYASTYALLSALLPCAGFSSSHSPAQHGAEAGRLLQIWLNANTSLSDGSWPTNMIGFTYDWAFPYLSASLKAQACTVMKTMSTSADGIYRSPWAADSSKICTCEAMFAAACAGDGFEDSWANGVLSQYGSRIIGETGVIGEESRVVLVGPNYYGSGPQSGLSYSNYQWPWWVLHSEAVRTAQGISKQQFYDLTEYAILPSTVYWWAYLIRPYALNNSTFPNGKRWAFMRTQYGETTWDVNQPAGTLPAVFAGIWKDIEPAPAQLAMWFTRQRLSQQPPTGYRIGQMWTYRFICEDPTIAELGPDDLNLPLSARFGDGRFEFKSAWDDDATTNTNWAVRFHAAKYLTLPDGRGPSHLNGSWEVHRKGPQTIIRGPGTHGWGGHGAFNQMYFRDNAFTGFVDGTDYVLKLEGRVLSGSAPYASRRGADIVPNSQADYLGEVRTQFATASNDFDYVFADLSQWYAGPKWTNSNNPATVLLYHDHKVLFRPTSPNAPVRVVVYRRYQTASSRYEPVFVWNPSGDAVSVDGSEIPNSPVQMGSGFGHWTYNNASTAIAVNTVAAGAPSYNGKNVLTVVRPTGRTIIKTGGPDESGKSFQDDVNDGGWDEISSKYSCEAMDIYGQRFAQNPVSTSDVEAMSHHGRYSIQVLSNPITTAGDFLMVNEVGDADMTPSACQHVAGTNFAGVAILGSDRRIAVFGTQGDAVSGSFVIPSAGTYRCLIANVQGSACEVTGGANIGGISAVSGGASPFAVFAPRTLYLTIVVNGNGTGAANTISLQASGSAGPQPPAAPTGVRIVR